jgi:hypothetical protein
MAISGSSANRTIERVNITLRTETRRRLNHVRLKGDVHINVSAVCDAAINAALDRLELPTRDSRPGQVANPGVPELAARVRAWIESLAAESAQGGDLF